MVRENEDIPCGWMTLFTRHGVQVKLPVPDGPFDYAAALANVESALAAGFVVTAPGLEEGEQKEEFRYVSRIEADGRSGPCSRVFFYAGNDAMTYKSLDDYLNTPEEVAAFERATGLRLDDIPMFPGATAPERKGKTERFCIKAPRPFWAVWKPNPKYKDAPAGEDTRSFAEKRKRYFVRWADQQPADAPQAAPAPAPPEQPRQQARPAPPSAPNPPGHETSAMKQAWTACHEAFQAAKLCGALTHPMWVERMKGYKASLIDDLNLHQRVETASWLNGLCKKHEPAAAPPEDPRKALTGEAV